MAELAISGLTRRYGTQLAVDSVDLDVASGEFVSLLGPSGCGKSTLLRMVAGLVAPTVGDIRVDGDSIIRLPPHRRRLGLVFQSYALFPHLSVAGNVAFGLRRQGATGEALRQRVTEALSLVRLGHLAEHLPRQLSGGQQQRVALARAIAPRPRLLLLDEPLSNLDAQLRDEMQIEITRLQRELGITSLFVTHDQAEALSMSDRVCVINGGRVQQVGSPEEIYRNPANGFVAGFIGRSNRLKAMVEAIGSGGTLLRLPDGAMLQASSCTAAQGTAVEVILRYDAVRLIADGSGLPGIVVLRSFFGARVQLVVRLESGTELVSEYGTSEAQASIPVGAHVTVAIDPASAFVDCGTP